MTQILDRLPIKTQRQEILCFYRNRTPKIQTIRISNIIDWYFEKVIFPGENLLFYSRSDADLEIYIDMTLTNKIICDRLRADRAIEIT